MENKLNLLLRLSRDVLTLLNEEIERRDDVNASKVNENVLKTHENVLNSHENVATTNNVTHVQKSLKFDETSPGDETLKITQDATKEISRVGGGPALKPLLYPKDGSSTDTKVEHERLLEICKQLVREKANTSFEQIRGKLEEFGKTRILNLEYSELKDMHKFLSEL